MEGSFGFEDVRNFVQLRERIGTSGQPTKAQFAKIAEAGYEVVLNLAASTHVDTMVDEGEVVTQLGMMYIHLPIPWAQPTQKQVKQFCQVMKALRDTKIWVHCAKNYRVSAFLFHYLEKVEGSSFQEARSPMFSSWTPNETWAELLSWTKEDLGL